MDTVKTAHLDALTYHCGFPSVSMYMPAFRAGRQTAQNAIRYKNLLRRAVGELRAAGGDLDVLEPARGLLDDPSFWRNQGDGLAVFAAAEMFQWYRLPVSFEELVVVTDRFHVKPLIPLIADDSEYFIVAASHKHVRLLRSSQGMVEEIEMPGVPKSLTAVIGEVHGEPEVQSYTGAPTHGARREAIFHGVTAPHTDEKAELLRYFREVADGVRRHIEGGNAPLIFAGVEYLFPLYREANAYPHLLDEYVSGNHDDTPAHELDARAREIVVPHFHERRRHAVARYMEVKEAQDRLASDDPREVVAAAHHSRVDTLFVPLGVHLWGRFHADAASTEVHEAPRPGDQDILDLAAAQTVVHRGEVHVLRPEEMPGQALAAALFRY